MNETFDNYQYFLNNDVPESSAALLTVAEALNQIAYHLKYLGTGNASTSMGAIEHLAKEVSDGLHSIAGVIEAHE